MGDLGAQHRGSVVTGAAMPIPALSRLGFTAAIAGLLCGGAQALSLDTRLIASGLDQPVYATAPLADGRVYIVQKEGQIRIAAPDGALSTFLSIDVARGGEQGLLGLAFDPGYADPASAGYRRFFVQYSDAANGDSIIASYLANADGSQAVVASRREVLRVDQPNFSNHKAGWIGFKPGDANNLYIAVGDGGSGNDPFNNAQNRNVLLGKILRVDIGRDDFADPNVNYAIPTDNPFVGVAGTRPEIFNLGLRNPWRNSFDRGTGDLWIADVGQGRLEEVNIVPGGSAGGQNFGWRWREGNSDTPGIGGTRPLGLVEPNFVYDRRFGASITGGYVVREAGSSLFGDYVFGDFVSGRVWAVDGAGTEGPAAGNELTALINGSLDVPLGNISSFGEGANGELFIVDYGGRVIQLLAPIPEPATWALFGLGLAGIALRARRRTPG
jgi:glucose/arabinose dehydrogenase